MNLIKENTMVRVSSEAPFHSGRIGYIEMYCTGASKGTVVLRDPKSAGDCKILFAVANAHIEPV